MATKSAISTPVFGKKSLPPDDDPGPEAPATVLPLPGEDVDPGDAEAPGDDVAPGEDVAPGDDVDWVTCTPTPCP